MRVFVQVLTLSFCVAAVACTQQTSDQEYATSFNKVCHDYLAYAQKLQNQPLPASQGMTKDQRREVIALQTESTGDGFQQLEGEEAALRPPAKFEPLHLEAIRFYKIQADLWHQWADAMRRHDQSAIDSIGDQIDTVPSAEWLKLLSAMREAFHDDPKTLRDLDALQQRNPIPGETSTGPASNAGYAGAWASICFNYNSVASKIRSQVPQKKTGMSQQDFGRAFGAVLKQVGSRYRALGEQERLLQPPPLYVALHADTIEFYDAQAKLWSALGGAMESDDKVAGKKVADQMDRTFKLQLEKIRADVAAASPNDPTMEIALESIERPNGIHHASASRPASGN